MTVPGSNIEKKKRLNQEILYLMQMNQKRRYVVVATSLTFALVWVGFAVLQSERLNLKAEQTLYYGNVLETIASVFCIMSLACAIVLIYTYNKQRKKEKELQVLNKENNKEIQDNKLEKSAIYLDTFASLAIVITELVVVFSIWGFISNIDKSLGLETAAMNFQGISDTISNVICFGVALMFLYIAINKYKSSKKAGNDKQLLLEEEIGQENSNKKALIAAGLITVGSLFMLIRKVLLSLEATNSINYTGNVGVGFKMDTLPLGLIFGVVGIAIFLVGFGLTIKEQSKLISKAQTELPVKKGGAEATPPLC